MDFLSHIMPGDKFHGVYIVESASERNASNGNKYLELYLRDKSGVRKVFCFRDYPTTLRRGAFIELTGKCGTYRDAPSLMSDTISECAAPDDWSNYMASFPKDQLEKTWAALNEEVGKVMAYSETAKDFRAIAIAVKEIYANKLFERDKFLTPAGTKAHYGKVGGFLMFTSDILSMATASASVYSLSEREAMLLKCAAMVCRCGCLFTYSFTNGVPSVTYQGELLGEAVLTNMFLNKVIQVAKATLVSENAIYSENLVSRFLHCVLAFNGLVKAKTKEAIALNSIGTAHRESIDCIDFIEADTSTEKFTAYDSQHNRKYLKD